MKDIVDRIVAHGKLSRRAVEAAQRISEAYARARRAGAPEAAKTGEWWLDRWDAIAGGFEGLPGIGAWATALYVFGESIELAWPDVDAARLVGTHVREWLAVRQNHELN